MLEKIYNRAAVLCSRLIRQVRFFQSEYESDQLFDSMRKSNIVMLTFGTFLGEIFGEGLVPLADILCCIVQSITQIL